MEKQKKISGWNKFREKLFLVTITIFSTHLAFADGSAVDKIYHPYVDALEKEFEYRAIFQDEISGVSPEAQLHKFSLGSSIGEHWFAEVYLIGDKSKGESFAIEAYELEFKWQLSEQGEFAIDWGMLFEYENEDKNNVQELSVALLAEKEWGRWSSTANLFITGEWGAGIDSELESSFAAQARYRYSPFFEPAIEFYKSQDFSGLGPVILGSISLGFRKKISWELGLIYGIDNESADKTYRLSVEFEF